MKRSISLVLCLAMLVSVFSCLGVVASAEEAAPVDASTLFTVKQTAHANDKITYTIYLNKGVNLSGAIIYAQFDTAALAIDKANTGAYMVDDGDGGERENISGMYVADFMAGYKNQFSIANVDCREADYKPGSSNKAYMQFTFEAISDSRPETTVNFYCYEFNSESIPENNIANGSSALIKTVTVKTLGETELKSVSSVADGVKITWKKTTGADYYRIFKKVNGSYKKLYDTTDGNVTSFIDEDVTANTSYTYTVRALNEAGLNASYDKAGLTTTFVVAPKTLTLTNVANGVTAKWSKVAGATGYRLFRRTVNADGTYSSWSSVSKKITALTFTDTTVKSGKTYEYAVRTFNGSAYNTLYSEKQVIYLAPTTLTAKATVKGVSLSWKAVDGAVSYKIYRKADGQTSWKLIKTVKDGSLTYTDTSAPSNKKITYSIRAVNGSYQSHYNRDSLKYLKTPQVSVENKATGIKASWGKVTGATKYFVYRKAGSASSWTKVAETTKLYYLDKNVKSGTLYKYCVRAVNSNIKSAYGGASYKGLRFLARPELTGLTSAKAGVTVKWNKVTGAGGYIVYRKTESGSFEEIAKVKGNSSIKFIDETAEKGVKYTYRVKAYYASYRSYVSTTRSITDKY